MKRICIALMAGAALLSITASAGYVHFNKKTMFDPNVPTAATIWTRNNLTGDLYLLPNGWVEVFDNTIKVVTNGVAAISYGYWQIDSNGDYVQIAADITLYTMRHLPGAILDCEWEMDSTGNFIPKE